MEPMWLLWRLMVCDAVERAVGLVDDTEEAYWLLDWHDVGVDIGMP